MSRFGLLLFLVSIALAGPARAALETSAEHAILIDADSGQIVWEKAAHTPMAPASMSKLMTLELLFERIKDNRVKLTDTFPVSERAWRTQGSKMFVKLGDHVPVESLIRGIIVDSGNDACIVVAEALGGTVEGFVGMMNARAKELGLAQSHFVNPDGLPDPPGQLMSAADLATLARHLIRDYPLYYPYFSERSFSWNNISQTNRDMVLESLPGADGLKTGHTDEAGYGITTSARQNGRRLILVLNGLRYPDLDNTTSAHQDWVAGRRRGDEAARILALAFREFRPFVIFKAGDIVGQASVVGGRTDKAALSVKPLILVMPVDSHKAMKGALHVRAGLRAPINKGDQLGTITLTAPDFPPQTVPVYAAEAVPQTGFAGRMWDKARGLMRR